MKNCVSCIFENKISDALKTFPAVLRALKSRAARLALCSELAQHVVGNKAMLEHQQFDLVARLMNCALQVTFQQYPICKLSLLNLMGSENISLYPYRVLAFTSPNHEFLWIPFDGQVFHFKG